MLCPSMGEGYLSCFPFWISVRAYSCRFPFFYFRMLLLVAYSVCILGNVWIGWIAKPSNDDFVKRNSIHELERLLMCDPFGVKLLVKVL